MQGIAMETEAFSMKYVEWHMRLVVLQGQVTRMNIPRPFSSCLLWIFHWSLRYIQLCCSRKRSLVLPESAFLWSPRHVVFMGKEEGKEEVSFNTKSSFAQSHELLKKLNPSQEGVFTVVTDIWTLRHQSGHLSIFLGVGWTAWDYHLFLLLPALYTWPWEEPNSNCKGQGFPELLLPGTPQPSCQWLAVTSFQAPEWPAPASEAYSVKE